MKRMQGWVAAALGLASATAAVAEPVGSWWSGTNKGVAEYGVRNDDTGHDSIYIACGPERTYLSFQIDGVTPVEGGTATVTIGKDRHDLIAGKWGYFGTGTAEADSTFRALWAAFRAGSSARVRLGTGETAVFTLRGSSRILDPQPCTTDFARG